MVKIEQEEYVSGLCGYPIYFKKKYGKVFSIISSADCIRRRFIGLCWNKKKLYQLFKCEDCTKEKKLLESE